ncbi:hypothetical protein V6N13_020406 [Hibiscus sabdariffa]|uniref:Uncharacterized protein n=1 Tax=Hibiscus sabdariffa TaxID=183260 RepID=A0ABR2ETG5_9ROSI
MCQKQSKDELLYKAAIAGNVDGIRALCREGAGLETEMERKTPLIVACMNPDVAKTLIERDANVNAYRPANFLLRNDDCHSPLEVARNKGCTDVVRAMQLSWVVIIPCGSSNPLRPPKFELAIYSTLQDAHPHALIALWKSKIEEPKFHNSDPYLAIYDHSTGNS